MSGKLFNDKRVVFVISLIISCMLWLTVSLILRPTGEIVVNGVGVNVNVHSGILAELGLSAIEGAENIVDVTISGSRSVIGGVSAEDISVTPSLSGVSGAGIYELELRAVNNSSKDFEIVGISPSVITVKFDKYVDKTLDLKYEITGEYNIPDEYVQERVYSHPEKVVITGPEIDVAKIEEAVVMVELSGDYTETVEAVGEIVLLDNDGNIVDYKEYGISIDADSATVVVPVHKTAKLPISFKYINVPENFDTSTLKYTLSVEDILVEGEDSIIDKYSDIFVGYVDLKNVTAENPVASFDIKLPEGLKMQSHVNDVDIMFDLSEYVEATFNATQINIINIPKEYKVSSNASRVSVTLMGPAEIINQISAKDVVVEVDLSTREVTQTGQYRMQAEVFLPNRTDVWAVGSYSVTVTVKNLK